MKQLNFRLSTHPRLLIVVAMLLWGASFPAMKYSIAHVDPFFVIFSRMFLGSLCLLPFLRGLPPLRYRKHDLGWLALLVLFEPCLYFYFEIRALQLTSATQAGFIAATLPLMVIIGSAILLREPVRSRAWAGMAAAFAGLILLTLSAPEDASAPNPLLGNLFELLAMISATGFTLILKYLADRYHPILLTFFQTAAGTLFFAFAVWREPDLSALWSHPMALAAILFLGIVVTVLAYVFYISGIQRIPANQAILFVNLIPVFSMALSILLLGERINAVQGIACILIIFGVWIGQQRQTVIEPTPA